MEADMQLKQQTTKQQQQQQQQTQPGNYQGRHLNPEQQQQQHQQQTTQQQQPPQEVPSLSGIPRVLQKAETALRWRTDRLLLVLDQVQKDHNALACLRTAEVLGVQNVWLIQLPHGHAKAAKQQQGQGQSVRQQQQQQQQQGHKQQNSGHQGQQEQQDSGQLQQQHEQQAQQDDSQAGQTHAPATHLVPQVPVNGSAAAPHQGASISHLPSSQRTQPSSTPGGGISLSALLGEGTTGPGTAVQGTTSPSPPLSQGASKKPRLRQGEGRGAATSAPTKAKLERRAAKAGRAGPTQEQLALALMDTSDTKDSRGTGHAPASPAPEASAVAGAGAGSVESEEDRMRREMKHRLSLMRATAAFLDVKIFSSVASCVAALHQEGWEIWATDLSQDAVPLGGPQLVSTPLPPRVALVMGQEGGGVSAEMLAAAHRRVYLPMYGMCDSLNVSVATGMALQMVLYLWPGLRSDMSEERRAQLRREWYVRLARSEEERSHFLALAESGGVAPVAGVTDMRDVLAAGRDHQHSTLISSHRLGESEAGRRATCMDGSGTACP